MRTRSSFLLLAAIIAPNASAQVGAPFCFGDVCPCGNNDLTAGCGNNGSDGNPATGAELQATGSGDVFLDDLELTATGIAANQFGLMVMAPSASAPSPVGDGLLCLSGGLFRFPPRTADASGVLREVGILAGAAEINAPVTIGSTWNFQAWHRDPGGPCGNGSNLTNAIPVTFQAPGDNGAAEVDLAGRPLGAYPFFERHLVSNEGSDLWVNIDPERFPSLAGQSVDIWVVESRSSSEWDVNDVLVDARGSSQAFTIGTGGTATGSVLVDAGLLNGTMGTDIGVPYDIVVDVDGDGLLSDGDLIDGRGDLPGVVIARDVTQPGPYATTELIVNLGGAWRLQDIYYPSNIASLGEVPLVVVSHGNGHNYQWYDHIGEHMASYGYVVMSHSNQTGPGIETASDTTLENTDVFLGNLSTIGGGVLDGHVDSTNIAWLGHSRGAEGVTRAYDKILDGIYNPINYTIDSLKIISSIAPTTFLGFNQSNPHGANFHLWVGSADADVSGGPGPVIQSYPLYERGTGRKSATTYQGVGHGAFHDGGGSTVASGPCQNGRPVTHRLMRGYFLPLVSYYIREEPGAEDFLWRQWEGFGPIGRPTGPCVVVNYEYVPDPSERLVVDGFQTNPAANLSSSGGAVTTDLTSLTEGRLQDLNSSLTWSSSDPFNGMTRNNGVFDQYLGITLTWDTAPRFLNFALAGGEWDVREYEYVSFRASPITRHPLTTADIGDLVFDITLVDEWGNESTLPINVYGGGVEEPYLRNGGWSNEFETHRFRLEDFTADGRALDLSRLSAVRFNFASSGGSNEGAIGFDDLEFSRE